jgi:hypothetical protein
LVRRGRTKKTLEVALSRSAVSPKAAKREAQAKMRGSMMERLAATTQAKTAAASAGRSSILRQKPTARGGALRKFLAAAVGTRAAERSTPCLAPPK